MKHIQGHVLGKRYYEQSEQESGEYRESENGGFLDVKKRKGNYRVRASILCL